MFVEEEGEVMSLARSLAREKGVGGLGGSVEKRCWYGCRGRLTLFCDDEVKLNSSRDGCKWTAWSINAAAGGGGVDKSNLLACWRCSELDRRQARAVVTDS